MAKRKRKTQGQEMKFDNTFPLLIRGMLKSVEGIIDLQLQLPKWEFKTYPITAPELLSPGYLKSAVILSSFSAELLLKYTIEKEGKEFSNIHDLHKLYNLLEDSTKESIENGYKQLISESNMEIINGYEDVKSVYYNSKDHFVKWRYVSIYDSRTSKPTTSYPQYIHAANLSIFNKIVAPDDNVNSVTIRRPTINERPKIELSNLGLKQ